MSAGGARVPGGRRMSGFSLIEVMVALLVLAFGLLGFALLQTMNVRFTESANYRTLAANLAQEMLDQLRVNRVAAAQYSGTYSASAVAGDCDPVDRVTPAGFTRQWQCRLGRGLGEESSAVVSYSAGVATVSITWGDQRWNDADKDGSVSAAESRHTFSLATRL